MAVDVPVPRSYSQILGGMVARYCAKHGIPSLKAAGPILSFLEAAAQSDMRSVHDVLRALASRSLADATGPTLDAAGAEEDVPRQPLTAASGVVTIGDNGFTKIATQIFAGTAAPIAGSTTVNVIDAGSFPAAGAIYLGRGTSRYEGPIAYTSKVNNTTYWSLVLASPTLRFHNQGETVVLAQGGDRTAQAGAIVRVPRSSLADAVDFKLVYPATIPDGEVTFEGVAVRAVQPGAKGNAPAGAVREWASKPWPGATVTNPIRYTNGFDVEDDDSYRERIRAAKANRVKGIPTALEAAAVGVISPDEGRRVLTAQYVARKDAPALLVVDDGTGYEERTAGVAIARLLDDAGGGELDLALQDTPVAQASIRSTAAPPYRLAAGAQLAVIVGGRTSVHSFDPTDFQDITAATAYEVAASINADANITFRARTINSGTGFAIYAADEEDDDIEVTAPDEGLDANDAFGIPMGLARTVLLYKNDRVLAKDGRPATFLSQPFGEWDVLAGSQTLLVAVDGTPTVTYTFVDQDFITYNTGYLALGSNSLTAWAAVFSGRIPGITARVDGSQIALTSNKGAVSGASVQIVGGTLVQKRMFVANTVVGVAKGFTLDRARGLIRLAAPAAAGDSFSAGTTSPRAFVESTDIAPTTLAGAGHLWIAPDSSGELVTHGVTATTPLGLIVQDVRDFGTRVRLEAFPGTTPTSGPFASVLPGDTAVLWDPSFATSGRGAWRVADVATVSGFATRLLLERREARAARAGHTATALAPVGSNPSKVLVAGGWTGASSSPSTPVAVTSSVEIFDPGTNTWSTGAPMSTARAYHTATLLTDGRVLVVGGVDNTGTTLASAEIYDPTSDTWTSAPAYQLAVAYHAAIRLSSGKVLVAGGRSGSTYRSASAVYDPTGNTWSTNAAMVTARASFRMVLLPDNRVFAAGGETAASTATTACEAFTAGSPGSWASQAAMPSARRNHGLALVSTSTLIAVGDDRAGTNAGKYVVYTIGSNTWGSDTALPSSALFENKPRALVTLQDGTVLALYGKQGTSAWSGAWNGTSWTTLTAPSYADAPSKDEVAVALLSNNAATLLGRVVAVGGINPLRTRASASAEVFDRTGNAWSAPDDFVNASFTLSQAGLSIARTKRWLQSLTIPAAPSYTASAIAAAVTPRGASLDVYRTTRLRLRTNSHPTNGDILLAAADTTVPGLTPATVANDVQAYAAATSVSGLGTPDFVLGRILEEARATATGANAMVRVDRTDLLGGHTLVLARDHSGGIPTATYARQGRNEAYKTTSVALSVEPQATATSLRGVPDGGYAPYDRFWSAAPFALGPQDDLVVAIDDDVAGRYVTNLYRKATPVGSTYGSQITLRDADAGGGTLAAAFGTTFNFDDFAVQMRARGLLYSGDSTRSMLARYYLHGRAGERVRVRVAYPLSANAQAIASVDATTDPAYVNVRLRLPGGTARTLNSIRNSTRVGTACTAQTNNLGTVVYVVNLPVASASRDGSNVTTLTLTLPSGITDHGFAVGDILFLNSSDGNWLSGNVTVTARTATTVVFTNTALGTGVASSTNIGTLSADPQGEATFQGAGVVANDFVRVNAASGLPTNFTGETFRITSTAAGNIAAVAVEKSISSTSGTLTWSLLGTASYMAIWASNPPTATAFAASINALAAANNSTCPVTLTVTGSGGGSLTQGTVETANDASVWLVLADGQNHVGHTILPATSADDYQFVLKAAITSGLATGTDWANEDVRLVPVTPDAVVRWLAAPAVGGLFTSAEVALTQDGETVQIATLTAGSGGSVTVQGGLANAGAAIVAGAAIDVGSETVVRCTRADAAGLVAGAWVEARNSVVAQRAGVFTSSTTLTSWTKTGYTTFGSTTLWTQRFYNPSVRMHVERQGRYMVFSDPAGCNTDGNVTLTGLQEGDYVSLTVASTPTSFTQASSANLGVFRVVRVAAAEGTGVGGAFWIENPLGIEETVELDIRGISYDSVIPGDQIVVSHDLWGVGNRGTWTVEAVGVTAGTLTPQFANTNVLKVSVATRAPQEVSGAAALGTLASLAVVQESVPGKMIKKVRCISPDPSDGSYVQIRLDSNTLSRLLSASLGTVLVPPDKLGFPTSKAIGTDGYQASVGLVGAVNRVVQGDPADSVTYPGVAAAGTDLLVRPPVIRRVKIGVLVKTNTTSTADDLIAQVRETVVSVVNKSRKGPCPLAEIEGAVQGIQGVTAATLLTPAHTAANDVIRVAGDEKAFVLALEDVSVFLATD